MTPDNRDPRMSSKKLQLANIYHTWAHVTQTSPDPSPGLRAAQEGLQEPREGLEEPTFDEIAVIWSPEFRFWGLKVWICMKETVRIHLDTSRGLKNQ